MNKQDYEAENRKFFFLRKLDFTMNIVTFFYLIAFLFSLIYAFAIFVFLFKALLVVSFLLFAYEARQSYLFNKKYKAREMLYRDKRKTLD